MKWTKKAAIARMQSNLELQPIYEKYPLARLLVESAAKVRRYDGYSRICFHYAYKDWMRAVTTHESKTYWKVIDIIDDLLPPDASDLGIEGRVINVDHPPLPGLPNRPDHDAYKPKDEPKFRVFSFSELETIVIPRERARHKDMLAMLEKQQQERTITR